MIVMLGNHSSPPVHYWAGKYPNKIGWLVGPTGMTKTKVREWLPWALDNDAFSAWDNGEVWDEGLYWEFLDWAKSQKYQPRWAAVPDVVTNPTETFKNWDRFAGRVSSYGWPLAFVVQDGMTPEDVPTEAEVVFIGGSYKWKWNNAPKFAQAFDRVHIGRVNTLQKLRRCDELGVESVDGTGWFRRPEEDFFKLEDYLSGKKEDQIRLL